MATAIDQKDKLQKYIGVKKVWYGDVFVTQPTLATLKTWLGAASTTAVKNCHNGTFSYDEADGSETEYKNEFTGETYEIDVTEKGKRTIAWNSGQYTYEDMAALMGGEVVKDGTSVVGWKAPTETGTTINKGVVAQTKGGNFVVFTNAQINAKTTMAEKAMGLGVTATALSNDIPGIASEYRFNGKSFESATASA